MIISTGGVVEVLLRRCFVAAAKLPHAFTKIHFATHTYASANVRMCETFTQLYSAAYPIRNTIISHPLLLLIFEHMKRCFSNFSGVNAMKVSNLVILPGATGTSRLDRGQIWPTVTR